MTHQLVRHTALNFNQRSQRYIDESKNIPLNTPEDLKNYLVIPPGIEQNEDLLEDFYKVAKEAIELYEKYRKFGIKKEDIRFILPQGFKSTILVSGTAEDIKAWVKKRIIPQAQWEIRQVAEELNEFLSKITTQ